jgi:hypothetical protein
LENLAVLSATPHVASGGVKAIAVTGREPSRRRIFLTCARLRQRHSPPGGKPDVLWPPN